MQHSGNLKRLACVLVLAMAFSGCSEYAHEAEKSPAYMLYSPNGEPLNGGPLGKPSCDSALSGWFDRTAKGADGISRGMFLSDAETQFHKMDIDKNGHLVSEELDRYRLAYRQDPVPFKAEPNEKDGQKKSHTHNSGKTERHDYLSDYVIDPVMSADTNLDFQVTLAEFMAQAVENFTRLDSNHDNMLTRDEILASCHRQEKS